MSHYFRFMLSIWSWVTLVWVFGCSEQSPQAGEVSAEDIVGDPIVEITEETFGRKTKVKTINPLLLDAKVMKPWIRRKYCRKGS